MKHLWPRSLFGRLAVIMLVGIVLVLALSLSLFLSERERIGRVAYYQGVAEEIASATELLEHAGANARGHLLRELSRRRLRFAPQPQPAPGPAADKHPLAASLRAAMPAGEFLVQEFSRPGMPHRSLLVSFRLSDGSAMQVRLPDAPFSPHGRPPQLNSLFAALAALVVGIALLTWLAVGLATRPLSRLAAAARALGENPDRAPLDTSGPLEVSQAAQAFNHMQERIRDYVNERTRILAAISHDLQTPITRLRLRAELVDDEELRARIQSDLDSMQALVREGLAYARSMDEHAPLQLVDVDQLLAALRDDATDMGWQVTLDSALDTPLLAPPTALRRALWNLIENAVKFGGAVDVSATRDAEEAWIRIRDRGPGLDEDKLEKVFEPFYRVEHSRNRATGGTGLGLAITRNLLRRQGGKVHLRNHPDGGLEAVVQLPLSAAAVQQD